MTSESRAFCPRCGDPVPERPEPRPGEPRDPDRVLCDACYLERFDLVDAPERVEVTVCPRCGAVRRGERWVDVDARDYTDVAVDEVSESLGVHVDAEDVAWAVEPEQADPNTVRVHATFTGKVRGTPVEESVTVPVSISRGACTRCGRIAGDYYAGIVQVRADGRTPTPGEADRAAEIAEEVVESMAATGDRDAFVTEITEADGGIDVKVSTTKIGKKIARRVTDELGGGFSSSETLVTEDESGDPVYRVTYAVRLPRFSPGDVIDPDDGDGPVLVRSVRGNVKGVRLESGGRYEAPPDDLAEARRLGGRDDAEETALVAVEDDHAVQVLDPETYRAETIPRPDYLDPDAETVRVLKSRAGLHVLPDDDG